MVQASQLQEAAEQLRDKSLDFADQLDKAVLQCNKTKVVTSSVGVLASVVAVGAGTALTVLSCGAAAPFAIAGGVCATAATAGTAAVSVGESILENCKMDEMQQELNEFIRTCRKALDERGISVDRIETAIKAQANVSERELQLCVFALAFHLFVTAPLQFYAVVDCHRAADEIASTALSNPDALVAFNWAKLLECIRNRPILLLNTGVAGLNLYELVKASIAVKTGKKSKVGNVFRDLASFLDDIIEGKDFINSNA